MPPAHCPSPSAAPGRGQLRHHRPAARGQRCPASQRESSVLRGSQCDHRIPFARDGRLVGRRGSERRLPCVKLKVGGAGGTAEELARAVAVRRALGPEIKLRLDANGAWSAPEAIETIQALEECDLELVEQPVPPGSVEGMKLVRENVETPIATDEGVTDLAAAIRLLDAEVAQFLVVKPMVVGGLRAALEIAKLGERCGVAAIVTTTIDSGVGTAAALHLAAALPSDGPACGLATASLLKASLIARPLVIERGRMHVPAGPGLGVDIDYRSLSLFAGPQTRRFS